MENFDFRLDSFFAEYFFEFFYIWLVATISIWETLSILQI